jgi:YhcH/YjgK/YiaL family protein
MRNTILKIMAIASFLSFMGCRNASDPSKWNDNKVDQWFKKGEWLNGWNALPDPSINKREFAVSYFKNKTRWDNAFLFLKNNDLKALEIKRHDIDGNNLYATVSEYTTKNLEDAKFESHQKYIDIQYVVSGTEQISVAPQTSLKEVLTPYDPAKDIEFMSVEKQNDFVATPERFFIFFPSDLHRPGVKTGENSQVRKLVIKVAVN